MPASTKLMMRGAKNGGISAYEYRLDGNELFTDSARIKPLQFLKDQGIFFERTDKGIRLEDSDIPSKEVTAYYIKESAYYDQATSTFHTKVLALCPIWVEEWGGVDEKKPLFWVKYDDLAPFLAKQTIMTSNLNNAATMSVDDYFTLNMYKGTIYKTNNMLGESLARICGNDSTKISAEQKRIEAELKEFETHIWGKPEQADSLDSIAAANVDVKQKKVKTKEARTPRTKSSSVKSSKTKERPSSSSSSGARVSVRRQRQTLKTRNMKQLRILAVALALIGTLAAQAQVKFGVKGGIEVLDFKSDFFNADNRMGWFIGPTVKIGLPLPGFARKLTSTRL